MPGVAGVAGVMDAGDGAGETVVAGAGVAGWKTMEPVLRPGTSWPLGAGAAAVPVMVPASSMVCPCWDASALKAARLVAKEPSARAAKMLSRRVGAAGVMPAGAGVEAWRRAMRWLKASGDSSTLRTPPLLTVGREAMEPGGGGVKAMGRMRCARFAVVCDG